jgi:hypothetical protein
MKKILLLAVLAALLITGLVIAEKPFMVKCCVKGNCRDMTRPECAFHGGRIVADCGQCK